MRSILILSVLSWTSLGAFADESTDTPLEGPGIMEKADPSPIIPEPTAALLAGIGGLALLFFATHRRK